jgi:hypothetical protein
MKTCGGGGWKYISTIFYLGTSGQFTTRPLYLGEIAPDTLWVGQKKNVASATIRIPAVQPVPLAIPTQDDFIEE